MPCPESLRAGKRAGESMKRARGRCQGARGAGGAERPLRGRGRRGRSRTLKDPFVGERKFKCA
jgi:hypothetical protein